MWWVFSLWTVVYAIPYAFLLGPFDASWFYRALSWLLNFGGAYWYLPCLAFMFLASKLLSRFGAVVVVVIAFILYVLAGFVPTSEEFFLIDALLTVKRFMMFFFWFALGAFGVRIVQLLHVSAKWMWPALIVGYYFVARIHFSDNEALDLSFVLSVLGIMAIIGFCDLVVRDKDIRRFARYIAGRTLPIYIFHALLIAALRTFLEPFPQLTAYQSLLLMGLLVLGLVTISCLLWDFLSKRAWWLFKSPFSINKK